MGNNDSSVETFLQWIKASDNIVFFGGAGASVVVAPIEASARLKEAIRGSVR